MRDSFRSATTAAAIGVVAVAGNVVAASPSAGPLRCRTPPVRAPRPPHTCDPGDVAPLEPGTYVTGDPFLVPMTFTVPAGWVGRMGGPYAVQLGPAAAPDTLWFHIFDKVYADPCHDHETLLDPLPGPSVDELADALAGLPGLSATAPTDITLAGLPGKQVTLTAPATGDPCRVWELPLGATNDMFPGEQQRVSIVDVNGQRLVIDDTQPPGYPAEAKAQVEAIVDSIHFGPAGTPSGSPSPVPLGSPARAVGIRRALRPRRVARWGTLRRRSTRTARPFTRTTPTGSGCRARMTRPAESR